MNKKLELAFIVLFPLIVFLLVFLCDLKINYLTSLILVFCIPSLYLSIKNKEKVKKVAIFSILVSIPIALIFEIIGYGDNAWSVPNSVLTYRLFDFIPLEDYIWMFLVTYTIIIFYEHFCNNKFQSTISSKIKVMNYLLYSLTALILILFIIKPSLLVIHYSFLWLGIVFFIIPTIVFLSKFPKFFTPFIKVSLFFFYIHLIFELIGLKLNHWVFPSNHYIGLVNILELSFPIEELLFVMILGGFAACSYYEFFTNKRLK